MRIPILLILLSFSLLASAQKITITGRVINDDTEEPQPFASVQLMRTAMGATTDLDGYYTLTVDSKQIIRFDTLMVSVIGYKTEKRHIDQNVGDQTINFRLKASDYGLNEVTIHAGENPANRIVRNIIRHKPVNSRFHLDNYQVESYSKVEFDINNIPKELRNSKVLRPFKFIFDNVDSFSDVRPFLPVFMTENLNDVYYTKSQGKEKSIPKASKISGIENETVGEFLGSMNQKFEIYDNWFDILEKSFISPFGEGSLNYYDFYIMDSTKIHDRWSYKLKFMPKRKQENTFFGDFWVDMKNYGVEIANMRMSPDVNINWVDRVIYYYEAQLTNDSLWLPGKDKLIINFVSLKKSLGIIGRRTSTWKNFRIGKPETATLYEKLDPNAVDPATLEKQDTFWAHARHENLSTNEKAVYKMIDSIKSVPVFKTYVDVVRTIVIGYKKFGFLDVGPYFNMYSQNKVEGSRFRLGIGTNYELSKKFYVYGFAAYGLRDRVVKYGGEFQYNLSRRPFSYIGAAYKNDLDLVVENSEEPSEDNLFSGVYRRQIPQKLLKVEEMKVFLHKAWFGGWSSRIALINRSLSPYGGQYGFNFHYQPDANDPTRIDSTVRTTELVLRLRYAYKERTVASHFTQVSAGSRFPIVELQYTAGIKGILNSGYNYHKLTLFVGHWFNVPGVGWMKYNFQAGKVFGTLPYLLMEVHQGNETYFYLRNAFNGMNRYEFASDTYAQLIFEHHWDGFFLNHIPLIRKLKWREITGFKVLYGTLSDANRLANASNNYDRTYKDYVNNPKPGEGVFYGTFDHGPYTELSVGIENIFRFIRIDALWRMNYNDARYASPFTLRGTMVFSF